MSNTYRLVWIPFFKLIAKINCNQRIQRGYLAQFLFNSHLGISRNLFIYFSLKMEKFTHKLRKLIFKWDFVTS